MSGKNSLSRAIAIDEDLIALGLDAADKETVIRTLSDLLLKGGFVRESFAQAVIERERVFATGLPTGIPVAIPHTDACHSIHPALALATLSKPVSFGEMGNEDNELSVELVFLMAISDASTQVEWLARLIDLFSVMHLMEKLRGSTDRALAASLLREHLQQDGVE